MYLLITTNNKAKKLKKTQEPERNTENDLLAKQNLMFSIALKHTSALIKLPEM